MAATIQGKARQSTSAQHVSEGAEVYLRMLRDGTMSVESFKQVCVMAGLGFSLTVQADISTGQRNDATVVDIDEPNYLISIPNGTSIMPIRITHELQGGTPADANEVETLIAVDQDSAGAVLTNMTAGVIYNLNTLFGNSSNCAGYIDSTDTITDPVLDIELARAVVEWEVVGTGGGASAAAVTDNSLHLLYEPVASPIINGPACLIGYWGGDAAILGGFAQITWLEFPSTYFA